MIVAGRISAPLLPASASRFSDEYSSVCRNRTGGFVYVGAGRADPAHRTQETVLHHRPGAFLGHLAAAQDLLSEHGDSFKTSRVINASPVYYGWIVVLAASVGMAMTIPGQTVGVSLFIDGIMAELSLSRSAVSAAYTFATILGALSLSYIGRWIDRVGPRRAIIGISLIFALAVAGMGLVNSLAALFFGFLVLRAMGPGALSLVSLHAVNIWFVRGRGTAVGWMGVGLAVSTALFPPLIERGLDFFTWREMFGLIGIAVLAILLTVGITLFREKPENFGIRPDGADPSEGKGERSLTLANARRTPAFWMLTAGGVLVAALGTGLLFHHFSMMEMNGMSRAAAAAVFVPLGILTAVSNLSTGYLMDRIQPRVLLATMLLLFAVMVASVPFVQSFAAIWMYGCVFGLVQGMQGALMGSGYAHYFGRDHIGAIKGFAKTVFVGGTAAGPVIYAAGMDWLGSYTPTLLATAALAVVLAGVTAVLDDRKLLLDLRADGMPGGALIRKSS